MSTIVFPDHHSAVADAETLKKAFHGWGTDEKAVIGVLGRRNALQRKLIRQAYEELYEEDLVKRLESELSGDFEKAMYRWILDPEDREAVLLNVAIKKKPAVDYRTIIEISSISSPDELLAIKRAYQKRYNRSVEEDLAQHSSGDLRKLLVGVVGTYRYNGEAINAKLANSEAACLHNAIQNKAFSDEEVIRIITTRSKLQIQATLNKYKDDYSSSITKHLKVEPSSDYVVALHTTIRCITDHQKYYEKVIREALRLAGTDEDSVTRVIVSRAEKDLEGIKDVYLKRNSHSLEQAITKETSGHYKAFLLTLLGKQD
ncbi:hypothetical protein SASPL_131555 [Salvia splendens]|uniref:Annexin n=1 Tax=Salvia splendens TaxID=180675 RepID=A0A8X8ZKE5_SALSN|nr:annexin-like protein RJ4 [Salvia splendens]KAG6408542.1 hypothetical protein SASPL_131555 [Salvia splendens]